MPQITINEFDHTGIPAGYKASNTVFIPGPFGKDITDGDNSKPVLCFTVDEFKEVFGSSISKDIANYESWIMAHQLLRIGLPVLYWGGVNVTNKATAEMIYGKRIDKIPGALFDKALYDVRFITSGAISAGSVFNYTGDSTLESGESGEPVEAFDYVQLAQEMINAAYQRGDAVALLSTGSDESVLKPEAVKTLAASIANAEWFKNLDPYDPSKVNEDAQEALKFAAMFAPACEFKSIAKNEELDSNTKLILPGSFTYLTAFARSIQKNASWFAAAGSFRGVSPFSYEPIVAYGDAAINALQTRKEGDVCVDTIAEIRPFGNLVWGNRTLLPNVNCENESDGGLKASHFLNIRHLCCDLHKTLYRASRKYTFEQNDDILWANYQAEIKPLLDKMRSGRGIRGYRIIKVASNKKAVLKAKIRINPIEAVEDFYIDIELTDNLDVSVEIE
jgi:hypothetical protein